MFSRTLTAVTAIGTATLLSTTAFANCGSACTSGSFGHNMQNSSSHSIASQLAGGHSVSSPSQFSTSSQSFSTGGVANCPSGTTAQSDGTCLTGSSFGSSLGSSSSISTGSSYSGSSYDAGSINSQLSSIGSSSTYTAPTSTYTAPASTYTAPSSTSYVTSSTPSYSAPSYSAPSYEAPSYSAPSYDAPSYSAPSYAAPSYSNPTTVISGSGNGRSSGGSVSYSSGVGGSSTLGSGTSYSSGVYSSSATSYEAGQEYNGVSVPSLSTRFSTPSNGGYSGGSGAMTVSNSGSGSVSATFTDNSSNSYNNYTVVPFSTGDSAPLSSSYTLPSLGASESLSPTSCPVSIDNTTGARVLGCYNVSRPKTVTNYTRVVRPVVYVRYPVPTPVPYTVNVPYAVPANNFNQGSFNQGCGVPSLRGTSSRYGGFNNSGFGGGGFNSGFGGGFQGGGCGF